MASHTLLGLDGTCHKSKQWEHSQFSRTSDQQTPLASALWVWSQYLTHIWARFGSLPLIKYRKKSSDRQIWCSKQEAGLFPCQYMSIQQLCSTISWTDGPQHSRCSWFRFEWNVCTCCYFQWSYFQPCCVKICILNRKRCFCWVSQNCFSKFLNNYGQEAESEAPARCHTGSLSGTLQPSTPDSPRLGWDIFFYEWLTSWLLFHVCGSS